MFFFLWNSLHLVIPKHFSPIDLYNGHGVCFMWGREWNLFIILLNVNLESRSRWPRGLRRRSAAARLLEIVDSNPTGGMDICYEWCVLSGRGLCDELITRPEESYRLWCVVVCDLETSWMRRPCTTGGCCAKRKKERKVNLERVNFTFNRTGSWISRYYSVWYIYSKFLYAKGDCMKIAKLKFRIYCNLIEIC